ncbi:MAG: hypothetical protein C4524_13300 [Candidatus Zixiibacteriota bacterium]|nr:MAG: hypothetical protein C4524_13300 [candidate division Zixibacteria bacterium]
MTLRNLCLSALGTALLLALAIPARCGDLQSRLFPAGNASAELKAELSSPPETSAPAPPAASATSPEGRKVSRGGAILRSLIVPGWGESYLGHHGIARVFFWADVAIWSTVIGLETYSLWKEDQFQSYGAAHAGAKMEGKDDGFYADIGNYMSTEEYNEARLRNRDYDGLYTNPDYFWAWDSDQNRLDYDHMRIQSRAAHNRVFLFLGAAALNRLISVVDTGKKASDLLGRSQPAINVSLSPDPHDPRDGVRLVVTAHLQP